MRSSSRPWPEPGLQAVASSRLAIKHAAAHAQIAPYLPTGAMSGTCRRPIFTVPSISTHDAGRYFCAVMPWWGLVQADKAARGGSKRPMQGSAPFAKRSKPDPENARGALWPSSHETPRRLPSHPGLTGPRRSSASGLPHPWTLSQCPVDSHPFATGHPVCTSPPEPILAMRSFVVAFWANCTPFGAKSFAPFLPLSTPKLSPTLCTVDNTRLDTCSFLAFSSVQLLGQGRPSRY